MTEPSASYPYIVTPAIPVVGVYNAVTGQIVATLPGAIYNRLLTGVTISATVASRADLYFSFIDNSNRFDTTPQGSQNTADYSGGPRHILSNTPIVVVWSQPGGGLIPASPTPTASATFFLARA